MSKRKVVITGSADRRGDRPDLPAQDVGMVKVIHGPNDKTLPVVGCPVGAVRASLVDAFNIPSQALAFVNGEEVDSSHTLHAHDILEFCKERGNKGSRRMLTKADILQVYTGYRADVMDKLFATLRHDDVNADGQFLWHEDVVDEWLDEWYSRKRADDGSDKVTPPSSVRIDGREYDELTPQEWRLMEVLFASRSAGVLGVKIDDVIDHVWGHGAENKENALKQVMKRLNKKLGDKKCSYIVRADNGCVTITR